MSPISFINQVPATARIPRAVIYKTFKKAARHHGARLLDKHLSLVFMAEGDIKKLNTDYRHKGKATNVLSFASSVKGELGDIIICPAIARAEATERGEPLAGWVNYLFIHGLLHLLGYDHNNNQAEKLMLKAEAKLK